MLLSINITKQKDKILSYIRLNSLLYSLTYTAHFQLYVITFACISVKGQQSQILHILVGQFAVLCNQLLSYSSCQHSFVIFTSPKLEKTWMAVDHARSLIPLQSCSTRELLLHVPFFSGLLLKLLCFKWFGVLLLVISYSRL